MKRKITLLLSLLLIEGSIFNTTPITGNAQELDDSVPAIETQTLSDSATATSDSRTVSNVDELYKAIQDKVANITLKNGTYKLGNAPINLYSGLTLDLGNSTVERDGGTLVFTSANGTGGYDAYSNITVKNGTIKRSAGSSDTAGLMIVGHSSNVTLDNLIFTDANNGHMLEFAACKNVTVTNCTFKDGHYSSADDKGEYEAFTLDVATPGNFSMEPLDSNACENVTVSGCTFSNVRRAIGGHRVVSGHLFEKITIKDCKFNNITGTAIEAVGFKDSTISNNTLSQVGFGIDCRPSSSKILSNPGAYAAGNTISNNSIALMNSSAKTTCGVRISGNGTTVLSGFKVENITVTGPHAYAVYAGYVSDSTISGITSSGAATNAIRVEKCDAVIVEKSKIDKTKSHGIAIIDSKYDIISENTINNANGHGIAIESSQNDSIVGNTIVKPKKSGINLNKKSVAELVAENTVTKPKTCGINLEDKKSKITITYANTVKKAGHRPYGGKGTYVAADQGVVNLKKGKGSKISFYGKDGKAKFSTDNKKVATVDNEGRIKGTGKGTTIITAKKGKYYAKVKVTVK